MNEAQYKELVDKLGKEVADKIKSEMTAFEAKAKELATEAFKNGGITKEQFKEYQDAAEKATTELKEIARKQGISLTELQSKLESGTTGTKSIAEVLQESQDELKSVYQNGSGTKTFMVKMNANGQFVMRPVDLTNTKAAGTTGTVDGLSGVGSLSSISQSIDAASLLRLGGNSPIISNYRNTPWIFDLCNIINAGWDMPFAMWFEEKAKQGSSTIVPEGGTKPLVQYSYELKTQTYKKEAQLVNFTQEFSLDFARLESDILGKGRIDLINRINTTVLGNITSAATAYNTATEFLGGQPLENVNDFDVIAAMAAQVDNATYGNMANAAVMSTFKKYRMGVTKSTQGEYLNRPDVLSAIDFVGNPDQAADAIMVGDFRNYNIILRGGFIVRVGYNGTDFAENKFSVVMEQFYYDWISAIRRVGIVKGPNFADVKALLAA